jgi:nucleoside-diphosphate-sugar epimerase
MPVTIVTGAAGYLGRKVTTALQGTAGLRLVGTDLAEQWPWPDVVKEGPAFRSVHFARSSHAALRVGGLLLVLHPPSDSAKLVNLSWHA